jgi:hypothetical protein
MTRIPNLEVDMKSTCLVKITKEGKEMNEMNQALIVAGISDCAIKHHNRACSVHIQAECCQWSGLGLVHYNVTHSPFDYSFHGFRAVAAALETKRPPIDNRWQ